MHQLPSNPVDHEAENIKNKKVESVFCDGAKRLRKCTRASEGSKPASVKRSDLEDSIGDCH